MRVQIYEWLRLSNGIEIPLDIPFNYPFEVIDLYNLGKGMLYNGLTNIVQSKYWITSDADDFVEVYTQGIKQVAHNIILNKDSIVLDGTKYTLDFEEPNKSTIYLSRFQNATQIKLRGINSGNIHLRPCKLLAPYGNHPIGECAMIDVLSNTLYFNQGSGSFSVEGEAGEVIDTTPCYNNIINPLSTKAVRLREWLNIPQKGYLTFRKEYAVADTEIIFKVKNLEIGAIQASEGEYPTFPRYLVWGEYIDVLFSSASKNGHRYYVPVPNNIEASFKNVELMLNKEITKKEGNGQYQEIFNGLWTIGRCRISYFNIGDILHLVPCDILYHPTLPPQSAMIDLNSGDLYFNQGSGSFSCEGAVLGYWQDKPMVNHYCDVEGALHKSVQIFADAGDRLKLIWEKNVPWEVHRWLVMDNPNINGFSMETITNLTESKFKIYSANDIWGNIGVCGLYSATTGFYSLYNNNNAPWNLWSGSQNKAIRPIANYKIQEVNDFEVTLKNITINGVTISIDDLDIDYFNIGTIVGSGTREVYYSQILTDGQILTPAVLSRPTLASEDNNGIARKQGEAVFVDEQRYKQGLPWCFGNVALSGSFSVSDYLIEGEDFEYISGVEMPSDGLNLYLEGNQSWEMTFIKEKKNIQIAEIRKNFGDTIFLVISYNNQFNHIYTWETGVGASNYWELPRAETTIRYTANNKSFGIDGYRSVELAHNATYTKLLYKNTEDTTINVMSIKADTLNLVPVRLLRNIETYTTHNNKGGKVGEVGFFDTISGRFYGNDGSGEFSEYVP